MNSLRQLMCAKAQQCYAAGCDPPTSTNGDSEQLLDETVHTPTCKQTGKPQARQTSLRLLPHDPETSSSHESAKSSGRRCRTALPRLDISLSVQRCPSAAPCARRKHRRSPQTLWSQRSTSFLLTTMPLTDAWPSRRGSAWQLVKLTHVRQK